MANPNYSLFLIIFFIFIFFTFIMPKIDLYNKKHIDNIIPLITNTPINIVNTAIYDQISTQTLSPIQTMPILNNNIESVINKQHDLPQPNPIPIDNYNTIEHLDNTFSNNMKLDLNSCSQSCCKHTQWLPPFINNNNNISSEYIGSNFSCNLGNGSGCVCYTQKNSNFLENHGISN